MPNETVTTFATLDEVKAAVDAGKVVHWNNTGYVVSRDYRVVWTGNGSAVGLFHQNGTDSDHHAADFFSYS